MTYRNKTAQWGPFFAFRNDSIGAAAVGVPRVAHVWADWPTADDQRWRAMLCIRIPGTARYVRLGVGRGVWGFTFPRVAKP